MPIVKSHAQKYLNISTMIDEGHYILEWLAYWFQMNNNAAQDRSIQKCIPMMEEKLKVLMADPDIER